MDVTEPKNFIAAIIADDLANDKHGGRVVTRFPPEPNGYLHIGHAKSICLNFGLAQRIEGAVCHLRFDDTNPVAEDVEYVDSIQEDVRWLGFDWGDKLFFASDYFERLYAFAEELIEKGLAYVCSLSDAQAKQARGSITEPGVPSPDRDRSPEENLALFRRMRAGEFADGERVLRAKIDMAAANMKMRDPAIYRIRHTHHHRTGDAWCIYPLYDFTHCLSDSLEHITHSLCTLEFENNRELYDWFLARLDVPSNPQQIEFARLVLTYTVMSKRKLRALVEDGHVSGWDDPRMPTLSGLRRRGVTPEAIRAFAERVGVAKANSTVDLAQFEYCIRDDLNMRAKRVLCVLDPLEVVLENRSDDLELLDAPYFPDDVPLEGSRPLPYGRRLFIERSDFMLEPPKHFHRLSPGGRVRLRHADIIRCDRVEQDEAGRVVRLICSVERDSTLREGDERVKGTIHWVEASSALPVTVRLYDRLFSVEDPDATEDFTVSLNPESLQIRRGFVEPSVAKDAADTRYQFERLGFFWRDTLDSTSDALVFNRIVTLKDSWAKAVQTQDQGASDDHLRQEARRKERERVKAEQAALAKNRSLELGPRALGYRDRLGLPEQQAHVLGTQTELGDFFDRALEHYPEARSLAGWVVTELARVAKGGGVAALKFGPESLARLAKLADRGAISSSAAKTVFEAMAETGEDPEAIVERRGLSTLGDDELLPIVDAVLAELPDKVAAYRAGNPRLMALFIGQVMQRTRGRADPKAVSKLLTKQLSA